jgi:hypothetical protein
LLDPAKVLAVGGDDAFDGAEAFGRVGVLIADVQNVRPQNGRHAQNARNRHNRLRLAADGSN